MDGIPTLFWSTHFRLATPVFLVAMLLFGGSSTWNNHDSVQKNTLLLMIFFIEHGIFPLNPLVAPGVNPFAFCWTPNLFCFYPWTLANLLYGCLTSHFHLAAEIESFGCVNLQVLLSQWYYIKHNIFLLNNSSSSWLYPHVYFLLNFSRLKSGRCLGCARENRLGCLWNHHLSCLNPLTFHILKLNLWHFRISTLFKGSIPCFLFSL